MNINNWPDQRQHRVLINNQLLVCILLSLWLIKIWKMNILGESIGCFIHFIKTILLASTEPVLPPAPPQRTASSTSERHGAASTASLATPSLDNRQRNGAEAPLASPPSRSTSTAAAELEANGQWTTLNIDAANLWVAYVKITTNSALRIQLQLPRGSPFAVYGRRNVAPSITRHDFRSLSTL